MQRKRIREEWQTFRQMAYPRDLPLDQLEVMRDCFYAGTSAMFKLMTDLSEGLQEQESDLRKMDDLHRELQEFLEEFKARHGGARVQVGRA